MMNKTTIEKIKRQFLPENYVLTDWESLQPYLDNLKNRPLETKEALEQWMKDLSEVEAVIGEDAAWRQINMTLDTTNKQYEEAFTYYCMEIEPKMKPYFFELNKKLLECPYTNELDNSVYYPYIRAVKNAVELYREENVQLEAEMSILAQQYGAISSKMTINHEGKEYTLQQAAKFLQQSDRQLRETVYRKIADRRQEDVAALNELFNKLLVLRQQVAKNAGFDNYRDYKFKALGRFDYTPEDCFAFHDAVRQHILPLNKMLSEQRRKRLGLETMRPWDGSAEPVGTEPLHPFETGTELSDKSVQVFGKLRDYFSGCLQTMTEMKRLDLESRVGKAPGGYNCPLPETGVPFIFMNAAGTIGDLITMMHEGGHAVHSFLSHDLPLSALKEYPMEIAELASMSMELFSMEHWNVFFTEESELHRAKLEELERVISVLPWIATIDKFQHWLYTNPGHTDEERTTEWLKILDEFSAGMTDWSGLEKYRSTLWQKQLHLYEVPFYYIEYGIAQLGAIAMWRQYRENKEQALDNYMAALSKGYTQTLPELYKTAGIQFNFSPAYVSELGSFVKERLNEMGVK